MHSNILNFHAISFKLLIKYYTWMNFSVRATFVILTSFENSSIVLLIDLITIISFYFY